MSNRPLFPCRANPTHPLFIRHVDKLGSSRILTKVGCEQLAGARFKEPIPVEQPMKFEFVVNLKTAKQIGVTIPPNVLVRAQKVIK